MNITRKIIEKCNNDNKEPRKANVLMLHKNERYEKYLALTGNNFFYPALANQPEWEDCVEKKPDNIFKLGEDCMNYQYLSALSFDLIIAQNRTHHWQIASSLSRTLGLPCILTESYPPPTDTESSVRNISADINIFDNEKCKSLWGLENSITIHEPICNKTYYRNESIKKENDVMTVLHNRDADPRASKVWEFTKEHFPNVKCVGNYKDISKACESQEELAVEYNKAKVYANMNITSSTALREAMMCECAVVTMTDALNEIVEDGVNGFICNDLLEFKNKIEMLINNPDMANTMGKKARESVEKKHSLDNFIKPWNQIFDTLRGNQI